MWTCLAHLSQHKVTDFRLEKYSSMLERFHYLPPRQTLLELDAEKMDKQKAIDLITQLHEKLLEVNCITKGLIEWKQKRMYIFTIWEHPMTGPFFEPSVIETIYEQLPTKEKPKIVDANCKFMMNDRSLMKHLKKCTKSTSGLSQ